jgi:hypothetical protein
MKATSYAIAFDLIGQFCFGQFEFAFDGEVMKLKLKKSSIRNSFRMALLLLSTSAVMPVGQIAAAQTSSAAPAATVNRVVGTVTAVSAGLLTVKSDAGVERKVTVPDGIKLQRIVPGEKDLSKAATIQFTDLAVGDRVLVRLAPEPTSDPVTAISIVAIPQADIAQKQQKEREEWQRNGVGGLVKSVDAGTGLIMITSGAGPTEKTISLHTTPATILRRYAPDSVDYNQAKPAPLEVIKAGDQLRARGTKSADGMEVAAVEVVSGSFRNISGTINAINQADSMLTMKDLLTKQNVTVHVSAEAQMRKLPEMMAKVLASMTKPGVSLGDGKAAPETSAAAQPRPQYGAGNGADSGQTGAGQSGGPAGNWRSSAGGADGQSGRRGGDLQSMLSRAPTIHLADLQKGDAVMLVSTQGTSEVTAVTLLAGVEPLLQAPASTQNMLLSNWSMSSGGAEAAQ